MGAIISFRGQYAFLSNFYDATITYAGLTYQNSEAAFQAQKCVQDYDKKKFCNLNPSEAKRLGRRVQLRSDWDSIKYRKMYEIVKAKFEQNDELRENLIATGDAHLEEGNTWGDRIWGTVNGIGENHLGITLMKVREELSVK